MAYNNSVSWLDPRRQELVMKGRKATTDEWGRQFKTDVAPTLAREGWSAGAIGRRLSDISDKWGRQFADYGMRLGEEQLGEEYKTNERLGSEKYGLKTQSISEMNAMRRLRMQMESNERIAAEDRVMAERLAASNRKFSRRMGYLQAGLGLATAGIGGWASYAGAKYAANKYAAYKIPPPVSP